MKLINKKIYIASDHAGFPLKEKLTSYFLNSKIEFVDLGTNSNESTNYVGYGKIVAEKVSNDKDSFGVAICGSGIGISIAANRNKGARAALCHSKEYAELSRMHNDANILCLGSRFTEGKEAIEIFNAFIETDFEGGRHADRVSTLCE